MRCWNLFLLIHCLLPAAARAQSPSTDWRTLAPPVVEGAFVRPAENDAARPIWGHAQGLQIGIAPMPGPRGLLRVYTPYLGQPEGKVINYIAVEPIRRGQSHRGLSELEFSKLDQRRGKRFWAVNDPGGIDRPAEGVARGNVVEIDGVKALQVFIAVEPFESGADVYLRLTFRADRRHEVGIATFAQDESASLDKCIVTATMGNYARLRVLKLEDRTTTSGALWPDYREVHFAPHARFPLAELHRADDGAAIASAWSDEADLTTADYVEGTRPHWHYVGAPARQYWRCEDPDPALEVLVNGRFVYWNSRAPIPGGISFENFEMAAPFKQGQEFWFGVAPLKAKED